MTFCFQDRSASEIENSFSEYFLPGDPTLVTNLHGGDPKDWSDDETGELVAGSHLPQEKVLKNDFPPEISDKKKSLESSGSINPFISKLNSNLKLIKNEPRSRSFQQQQQIETPSADSRNSTETIHQQNVRETENVGKVSSADSKKIAKDTQPDSTGNILDFCIIYNCLISNHIKIPKCNNTCCPPPPRPRPASELFTRSTGVSN